MNKEELKTLYKKATELFVEAIQEEDPEADLHITDLDYSDGYFIFDMGENSVVRFHIDKCPGWLFGLWWSVGKEDKREIFKGEFFAQYEAEIDKFKPTVSMFCEDFGMIMQEDVLDYFKQCLPIRVYDMVKFIKNEPYLAFYRDYNYVDFNLEYVDKRKAKRFFERYKKRKAIIEETKAQNTRVLEDTLFEILNEAIKKDIVFVFKLSNCWPAYITVMRSTDPATGKPLLEDGDRRIHLFEIPYCDAKENEHLWNTRVGECKARAKKAKYSFYNDFDTMVNVLDDERYEKLKKQCLNDMSESNNLSDVYCSENFEK